MAHDVFISHSSKDKVYADALCAKLESEGIKCWIAPRDILPGETWATAIVDAIESAHLMVLLFSSHANTSPQVERELERALNKELPIVPLRIESVMPGKSLEYFLGTPHWLDAVTPPFEQYLEYITQTVKVLLERRATGQTGEIPHPPTPPPPPPTRFTLSKVPADLSRILVGVAAVVGIVVLVVLGWWLLHGGPVARQFVGAWTNTNFIGPDKVQFTLKVDDDGSYRYQVKYRESGKVNVSEGQIYLETADGLERTVGPPANGVVPPTPADLVDAVPDGVWDLIGRFSHARAQPPSGNPFTLVQAGNRPAAGSKAQPAMWEWDAAFGKVAWQMHFTFDFDGRYTFTAHASDAGRFEARDGKWKSASDVLGDQSQGSYSFVGSNSLVLAGTIRGAVEASTSGNTLWERLGTASAAPIPGRSSAPTLTPTPIPTAAAAASPIAAVLPSGAATMSASPAQTPSATPTATPAPPPIMALDRRFLLSRDTDVFTTSNSSSAVVGHLRRGRYVHITGLTGNWLRIRLPNGTVGFIPDEAVE